MQNYSEAGWQALKHAEREFLAWANIKNIPVQRVDYVATFEEWDKTTEIYIFFRTDHDLQHFKEDRMLNQIEANYRQWLSAASYPFDRWPIVLIFDSHDNVVKNYGGNYSHRLR